MRASQILEVYVPDKKTHDELLKQYVDENWANTEVDVDWEWSGPGSYRIHVHEVDGCVSVSFKWEGL